MSQCTIQTLHYIVKFVLFTCMVCVFCLLFFLCVAIYCNLLWGRDFYYHFFTYIHVLFSINVFKHKIHFV